MGDHDFLGNIGTYQVIDTVGLEDKPISEYVHLCLCMFFFLIVTLLQ